MEELPILFNIQPRFCPSDEVARERLTPPQLVKFEVLKALWILAVGKLEVSEDADFEDWVEEAARWQAVITTYRDGLELVHIGNDGVNFRNLISGEKISYDGSWACLRYGMQPRRTIQTTRGIHSLDSSVVDSYYRLNSFRNYAARRLKVVGHNLENELRLFALEEGLEKVMVKIVAQSKYAAPKVFTIDSTLPQQLSEAGFDWATVHLEGVGAAFLLQEVVEMTYETRLFVVNGCVVTSAGCIDSNTPLLSNSPYDPFLERHRGDGYALARQMLTTDFMAFAMEAAAKIVEENGAFHSYGMDVCLTPNGPAIVELNPLLNCGLYASSPQKVVGAIRQSQVLL